MTIENLKQIAIKYATTKGSRVPLAPDELCNAVVQYFNEFLKITADINTLQVAVTEEGGNIVFTITGNTLDGKAFTPIVITVDHNDFVIDQEFEEFKTSVTEQLNNKLDKSNWNATVYIVDSQGIQNNVAYTSNPSPNTFVYRDNNSNFVVNSPTENGNPTPKSYVDNALAGKLDAAGNNTFTGENTFNNSIYAKNGVVVGDTTNYGANSVTKGPNTYSFPNKSGTFAMTNDIIKDPIYFISFYANDPSEPCHLIGTMMSKNSYGTGQKTNEEFAVMLADNLYTNSNEGLAAYGKLAKKDILCIYSDDGLSIRCLDEENSEVDLPTVIFFVMETEL